MNTVAFVKYAGALVVLAICSACAGALREAQDDMAVAPPAAALNAQYIGKLLSVNGMLVTAAHANLGPLPSYAMIVPDLRVRSKTFEYIINEYGTYATMFDYPKSDQQIGKITNVGGQGCTNVPYGYGKKTFWIVAGYNQITEYTVPKKPIKTLSDSVGQPSSCAMDGSGDLAVGILTNGDIVIFKTRAARAPS